MSEETQLDRPTLEGKFTKFLDSLFGEVEDKSTIVKQFDTETWTVREPLYIAYGEVDGHGDTYKDEAAVEDLIKSFNTANSLGVIQPSLFHKHKTETFKIGNAWLTKSKVKLGDHVLPPLQPMVDITFTSKKAFEARLSGKLMGLSIGAMGCTELVKYCFEDMKGNPKVKRFIKSFSFLHKGAHLAYTDPTTNGNAAMKNDIFELVKSLEMNPLNEDQAKTLEDLEEEFVPLDKKLKSKEASETAPSISEPSEEVISGVDNENLNKGNDTDMSEELKKQNEMLLKRLAELEAKDVKNTLSTYNLSDEVAEVLAKALVEAPEAKEAVTKALDSVVEGYETRLATEAIEKADLVKSLEEAKTVESVAPVVVENELAKQLSVEHGHAEESTPTTSLAKSLADKVSQNLKSQ